MKKALSNSLLTITVVIFFTFIQTTSLHASQEEIAEDITTLLRAGRAATIDKTLIGKHRKYKTDNFVEHTKKYYKIFSGKNLDESNELLNKLMSSMKHVISKAKSGRYTDRWPSGDYENEFLPARFARISAGIFSQKTRGKVRLKLTTSNDLLINPANKADRWESSVIENKFLSTNWEKGKPYFEKTANAFRLILPEYYISSCMGCHGGLTGKGLHSGNIEGEIGELGGAISVILNE